MAFPLIEVRGPTSQEVSEHGAAVVFVRDVFGIPTPIFACSGEGWQQWGAERDVLGANVAAVEAWHSGMCAAREA